MKEKLKKFIIANKQEEFDFVRDLELKMSKFLEKEVQITHLYNYSSFLYQCALDIDKKHFGFIVLQLVGDKFMLELITDKNDKDIFEN